MRIRTEVSFNDQALKKFFKSLGRHDPLFAVAIILAIAQGESRKMKASDLLATYLPTAELKSEYAECFVVKLNNLFREHRAELHAAWCKKRKIAEPPDFDEGLDLMSA